MNPAAPIVVEQAPIWLPALTTGLALAYWAAVKAATRWRRLFP
jgi:hypothetical protein